MNKIVILYPTHCVLTKNNSSTETNLRLRKKETPHNETTLNQTENKHKPRRKGKSRKFNESFGQ